MIRFVNAKINLGLNILSRRDDGYHNLETLFYPVGRFNGTPLNPEPFCDILEINFAQDGAEDSFFFSGNRIDCPLEKNLVYKAVSAFRDASDNKGISIPPLTVTLEKHLPDAAGLGGGSADATFTLLLLNELLGNPLDRETMHSLAVRLGADCPFFLENSPVFASGIGEIMKPADLDLSGYWCVLVKPDIQISTKEAFAGITPAEPEIKISEIIGYPVEEWREKGLSNDFERHLFESYPLLGKIKEMLYREGALYASMSGSGSSLYGIFRDRREAEAALSKLILSLPESCRHYLCLL